MDNARVRIMTPEGEMSVALAHSRIWFDSAPWTWSDCRTMDGSILSAPEEDPEGHSDECGPDGVDCSGYWCPSLVLRDEHGRGVWRGHLSMN